ncbi:STAS domain-containing protein [Massilia sp. TS11]|uniref:STAS domain-containing protein n=1 Tax=Massilia sp. TS11 TaxID=2908003 RepID=UPI001EDB2E12|nr:STAS domain-containing protein [Massilia sp. TS11]
MGIFSLFKKKDDEAGLGISPAGEPTRLALHSEAERARQREIARATAMKIDAIELAMTSDLFEDAPRRVPRQVQPPLPADPDTLVMQDFPTTLLLTDEEMQAAVPSAPEENVAEEAALIYANGDAAAARAMLEAAIAASGRGERPLWWMLFDLYQACDDAAAFEQLSIAYAEVFETSPPPWQGLAAATSASHAAPAGASVALPSHLDASLAPLLAQLDAQPTATLDASAVRAIDAAGAALLHASLRRHPQLPLAGVAELAAILRPQLQTGVASADPAPWLLLLELLQRLDRAEEFETVAIDYCITYEVSPPQFVAPVAAAGAARPPSLGSARFPLVGELSGSVPAFEAHLAEHGKLIFDCSALRRLDYAAASALLARLRPLAEAGITIEFRALSHLVAGLLRLLGMGEVAGLYPHKY